MVVFVAFFITLVAFALVSYPLLRSDRAEADIRPTDHQGPEDLLAQRDAAYAAIKELEFELHLGNLSQEDYDDLRVRYRRQAADILRRLDDAERQTAASREVQARCPSCRTAAQPADRFCARCGGPLPEERAGREGDG